MTFLNKTNLKKDDLRLEISNLYCLRLNIDIDKNGYSVHQFSETFCQLFDPGHLLDMFSTWILQTQRH